MVFLITLPQKKNRQNPNMGCIDASRRQLQSVIKLGSKIILRRKYGYFTLLTKTWVLVLGAFTSLCTYLPPPTPRRTDARMGLPTYPHGSAACHYPTLEKKRNPAPRARGPRSPVGAGGRDISACIITPPASLHRLKVLNLSYVN